MKLSAYDQFVQALDVGKKKVAATAIKEFVTSFSSFSEKESWVIEFLARHERGAAIRHELYEELVFPVLLNGYRKADAWSIRWLADTARNLYRAKHLWAQVDDLTEREFLKRWTTLEPECKEARTALLQKMIEGFRYSEHEWPWGILYGANAATIAECKEIEDEVAEARELDAGGVYAAYLDQFYDKLKTYARRLSKKDADRS